MTWFSRSSSWGAPNENEVLFFALLVLYEGALDPELDSWAETVMREEPEYKKEGWTMPMEWRSIGKKISPIFARLHQAYSGSEFGSFKLQSIATAMKIILVLDITAGHLKDHKSWQLKAKGPPRWKTAASLFGVAALVLRRRNELSELLEMKAPPELLPSAAERVAAAQINIIHLVGGELSYGANRED